MNENPDNPFRSPLTDGEASREAPGMIRSRVFRKSTLSLVLFARRRMDQLRREAEEFINSKVGAANVVSVTEHVGMEYAVVVWFRVT